MVETWKLLNSMERPLWKVGASGNKAAKWLKHYSQTVWPVKQYPGIQVSMIKIICLQDVKVAYFP